MNYVVVYINVVFLHLYISDTHAFRKSINKKLKEV